MIKILRMVVFALGWMTVAFAFLCIFAAVPEGLEGIEIGIIVFFGGIGAGLIYLGKRIGPDNDGEILPDKTFLQTVSETENMVNIPNSETRQVICESCGAHTCINTASGGECEYCGSHII